MFLLCIFFLGGGGEGVELKVVNVYFCLCFSVWGECWVKRAISGVHTLSSRVCHPKMSLQFG